MKKKTKLIGICAGAAILVLGAVYTVFIAPLLEKEEWVYIESEVERGKLTVGVTESGSLDYGITSVLYDLDLSITTDEDEDDEDEEEDSEDTVQKYLKVDEVYVATGQRVSAGDVLIKFTEDSVEDVRKLLENALLDAQADYNAAESEYDLAVLEAQTTYETQKIAEKYAGQSYQYDSKNITDQIAFMQAEVDQRNANIAKLEEKLEDATENYNDIVDEYEEACESIEEAEPDDTYNYMDVQSWYLSVQTQYRNAETALKQARENLEENAEQIESLKQQIASAKAAQKLEGLAVEETWQVTVMEGENAGITYDATVESLKEDLQEEEEQKVAMEEQLAAFLEFVGEDGCIYATEDGIVTEVGYEAGDRITNAGTVVAYGTPENMTITVDVTQEDVVSLSVGNKVEIAFSAYPDAVYEGEILSIDTTATSRSSATISYQVVIGVLGDTAALYGGMTADVTFVMEEKEDVLYVSRKAIVEQNGKNYVYIKTALGGKELVEVETGIKNGSSIEIVSGLEESDVIYIASKVSSEEAVEETMEADGDSSGSNSGGVGGENGMFPGMGGNMPDMGDFGGMPDMGNMSGGMNGMEGRP